MGNFEWEFHEYQYYALSNLMKEYVIEITHG